MLNTVSRLRRAFRNTSRLRRALAVAAVSLGAVASVSAVALAIYVYRVAAAAPDLEEYRETPVGPVVYDIAGEEVGRLAPEEQVHVDLEQVPEHLRNALLATEDRRFFDHRGLDYRAVVRAALRNLVAGRIVQGAGTITQQLARTLYLTREQTFRRKIAETHLAFQLERRYDKEQILEMYLNEVYFGGGAYGIEAAAQHYFDKSVDELTLNESAVLVGVLTSPTAYSPFNNPEATQRRRNVVLQSMVDAGYLVPEAAEYEAEQPMELADPHDMDDTAPYFMQHVRTQLLEQTEADAEDVFAHDLEVHTTLDLAMQQEAEAAVEGAFDDGTLPTVVDEEEPISREQPQAALVSVDAVTGGVRAMIGGRGGDAYNRAVVTERQPGSAFKPFVYSAALQERDYHPGTVVNDMPMYGTAADIEEAAAGGFSIDLDSPPDPSEAENLMVWPRNYDDTYHGLMSLRDALADSLNIPAVRLAREVGVPQVREHAEEFGFTTFGDDDGGEGHHSFALGGLEHGVTPLEMASAFSVFANQGIRAAPHTIRKIVDNGGNDGEPDADATDDNTDDDGETIFEADVQTTSVLSAENAYIMRDMLRSSVEYGTGQRARLPDTPVAGKTGTTDLHTDGWFIGFADETVTSIWVGEDRAGAMMYAYDEEYADEEGQDEEEEDQETPEYERLGADPAADPDFAVLGVHASEVWGEFWSSVREEREEAAQLRELTDEVVTLEGRVAEAVGELLPPGHPGSLPARMGPDPESAPEADAPPAEPEAETAPDREAALPDLDFAPGDESGLPAPDLGDLLPELPVEKDPRDEEPEYAVLYRKLLDPRGAAGLGLPTGPDQELKARLRAETAARAGVRPDYSWDERPEDIEEVQIDANTGLRVEALPDSFPTTPETEIRRAGTDAELLSPIPFPPEATTVTVEPGITMTGLGTVSYAPDETETVARNPDVPADYDEEADGFSFGEAPSPDLLLDTEEASVLQHRLDRDPVVPSPDLNGGSLADPAPGEVQDVAPILAPPLEYRSGPETIDVEAPDHIVTADGQPFQGTYVIADDEPVQKIDSEVGLPVHPERVVFEPKVRLDLEPAPGHPGPRLPDASRPDAEHSEPNGIPLPLPDAQLPDVPGLELSPPDLGP